MVVYQMNLAQSYAQEHVDKDGNYEILVNNDRFHMRQTAKQTFLGKDIYVLYWF